MIAEAIEKILEIGKINTHKVGDLTYAKEDLHLVKPPQPITVECSTLQGLVDLYEGADITKTDEAVYCHVLNPTTVEIASQSFDGFGRRQVWARAIYPKTVKQFPFNQFLDTEAFIIGASCGFQRVRIEQGDGFAHDLDYVLKMAGNVTAGATRSDVDDGVTQTVQVRAGVTLKAESELRPVVNLAPYRTFAEIDQVISQFVFRARGDERAIQLALFEADGGRWALNAVSAIGAWLEEKLGDAVPVVL